MSSSCEGERRAVPVDALAGPDADGAPRELLHLGRHRGDAAQPVPLPARLSAAGRGPLGIIVADEFLRRPVRAADRAAEAAAARQLGARHAGRLGAAGPAATSTPAGRTTPGWCGACRCWRRRCWSALVYLAHQPLQPAAGAGLRRGGALPHAGLSPVQPLLHRHPRGAGPRRRGRGAPPAGRVAPPRCQRTAAHRGAAPCDRACAAGRAPPCVRRVLLVRRAARRWAWGRRARCSTAWPSSPAATGPTGSARSTRRTTSGCCRLSQPLSSA